MSSETKKGHTEGEASLHPIRSTTVFASDRCSIAECNAGRGEVENGANARRIVALWNMAHRLNLSTESVEQGAVERLVEAARAVDRHYTKMADPHNPEDSLLFLEGQDMDVPIPAKLALELILAAEPFAEVGHAE